MKGKRNLFLCVSIFFFSFHLKLSATTFPASMTSNIVVAITTTGFGFFNNIFDKTIRNQVLQNYVDLLFRDMSDAVTTTPVCYCWEGQKCEKSTGKCNTSACPNTGNCDAGTPGAVYGGTAACDGGADDYAYCRGWEYKWLMDTCIDIPLLGQACFAIRLQNIDSDPYVVQYAYTCASSDAYISSQEGGNNEPDTCVPYDTVAPYDDDDAMRLTIDLRDLEVELEFGRPWADAACLTSASPGCYANPPSGWQNTDPEWLGVPASTRCDDYIYAFGKAGTSLVCNWNGASPCCSGITASVDLAPGLFHRQTVNPHTEELSLCAGDIILTFSFAYDWTANNCVCQGTNGCVDPAGGTNVCPDADGDGWPNFIESFSTAATYACSDFNCDCDISDKFPAMIPFIDTQFSAWFDDTISSALDQYVGCSKAFDLTSSLQNPHYDAKKPGWDGGITHPVGKNYIGYDIGADMWYCYRPWGGSYNGGIIIGRANIDTYWLKNLNADPRTDVNWTCDPCYNGAGSAGAGFCDGTTQNDQCYLSSIGYTQVTSEYNPVIVTPNFAGNAAAEWTKLPFTGNTVGGNIYDVGIAIHEQVLSEAIYEVLRDGILSLVIDKDTPGLGDMLADFLTTEIFGYFLPDLPEREPDRNMRLAIVPNFDGSVASRKIRAYSTDDVATIPKADGSNLTVNQDIVIRIPRFYIDFWVDRLYTGSGWQKIFRMDMDLYIGAGLDILACTSTDVSQGRCNNTTTSFKIAAGLVFDPWVSAIEQTTNTIYTNPASYQDFMGDFLPILLSGILGGNVTVSLDLFPIFDPANLSIRAPLIAHGGQNIDTADTGDPTAGDYFAMYLRLWESGVYGDNIDAKYILDVLEGHINLGISFGGLPAPPQGEVAVEPYVPDTVITDFVQIDEKTFGVYFTGYDDNTPPSQLKFAYRIDNGTWTPFFSSDSVAFKIMREGTHTVEVMAKDSSGYNDPIPARYTFRVDRVGPHLGTYQGIPREIPYGEPLVFDIYAKDYQAPDDKVLVSYNIDGKGWTSPSLQRHVEINDLELGKHILRIRGYDDLGNMSEIKYEFLVVEKLDENRASGKTAGFGCAFNSHSNGGAILFLIVLLPLFLRRVKEF